MSDRIDQIRDLAERAADASSTPAPTTPKRRRKRRTRPRSKTISQRHLGAATRAGRVLSYGLPVIEDYDRPQTREACRGAARPCPWVGCKHHLYLDVNVETGSIKLNFPDLEPWELKNSCALDVAERGGITLEEVGEVMNLTRERIRQVEVRGLIKLKQAGQLGED